MKPDPIIAEVYRAKDEFAREIGNDVGRLFDRLREDAKKHPERMAQPVPKATKRSGRRAVTAK